MMGLLTQSTWNFNLLRRQAFLPAIAGITRERLVPLRPPPQYDKYTDRLLMNLLQFKKEFFVALLYHD